MIVQLPPDLRGPVHGAAAELVRRGAVPGSRIAIEADGRDATAWLLGADLLGAASLVVAPAWTPRERAAVLGDAVPDVTVSGAPPPDGPPIPPFPGDPVFYLATTSGSSGRPKVLARTRRSWRMGFDALGPVPGPVLVPGPLASSLFLFGTVHALHHGRAVCWRDRLDVADVADVADAGTVHLVPAMLSTLLSTLERTPAPVGLRTIVCGGAHVGDALRRRCARLLPGTELVEYYGSAEHSLIAIRRDGGPLCPVPGVDVSDDGGDLRVRSPQSFSGYLRGGRLVPVGDGFLGVGDRGRVHADGSLSVLGRDSATISSGGTLVAAEEVEDVLRSVPGVRDVVVAGTPHARLGAVVTAVLEAPAPSLRDLRAAARAGLAPGKRPRRWLEMSRLPRLTSGKVARAVVAEGLTDGTLTATPIPSTPVIDEADNLDDGSPPTMIGESVRMTAGFGPVPDATADHGPRARPGGACRSDA